jgi:transcriptional regulator GlxA family with amidase domain
MKKHERLTILNKQAMNTPLVCAIVSFLDRNIQDVHSMKDIATEVKAPLETIRKSFYRATMVNLSHYVSLARIEKAKWMLSQTDMPCKMICFEVGVREDVGARLFRRITGMNMSEFRNKCRSTTAGRTAKRSWVASDQSEDQQRHLRRPNTSTATAKRIRLQ